MSSLSLFLFFIANFQLLSAVSSTEFIYNTNFNSTNIQLFGNAAVESSTLSIDAGDIYMGCAFYSSKILTKASNFSRPLPFSTSFIFSLVDVPNPSPGTQNLALIFTPSLDGINCPNSIYHDFTIKFLPWRLSGDLNNNRFSVRVRFNNAFSSFVLDEGVNYQVWIDYLDKRIDVAMAPAGQKRPQRPLITEFVDDGIFSDEMYVGFVGLFLSNRILAWSFSNGNFSIGDALVTSNLPSFVHSKGSVFRSKGFIVIVSLGTFFVICCATMVCVVLYRRERRKIKEEKIGDWELEYWPHRIGYKDIYAATQGFSDQNVVGFVRKTKVFKGVLLGEEVAVKRIPYESEHEMREFLSEISSLGRLKHRNLVPLRGWCKKKTAADLILVYDYMENGVLDKKIFDCDENTGFSWMERIKILKDVAQGILYLHEGWEMKVLHGDIKVSNVLLDKNMNARLGDFGLARMHHHDQMANTTGIVGTVGYMAPEFIRTGRVSTQTDIFSFGVLVLEVVFKQRQIEKNKPALVGWIWRLREKGEVCSALYEELKGMDECSTDEIERVLHLGLSCTHPNPDARPTMRQVVKVLEGENLDISLLEKINSAAASSGYDRSYPAMEETFHSHCTCSLTILEGR